MSDTMEQPVETLDDILSKTWDEMAAAGPERDEAGRFAAKAESAEESAEAEQEPAAEQTDLPDPPAAWPEGFREHWATLAPEVRDSILQRETQVAEQERRYKEESREVEPIRQAIAPYSDSWAMRGVRPDQAIGQLLAAQDALTRNFDGALPELIRAFGRDPMQAAQAILGGQSQVPPQYAPAPAVDPRVDQIMAELEGQRMASTAAHIEEFAKAKDEKGAPLHAHFEAVREDMGKLIQADLKLSLKEAYDRAVWANPETRKMMLAAQQMASDRSRPRVPSSPRREPANVGVNDDDLSSIPLEDALSKAWDRLVERRA